MGGPRAAARRRAGRRPVGGPPAHADTVSRRRPGTTGVPALDNATTGEFTVVNEYLVRDLKRLGLWDDVMVMDLKHFDGSLRRIDRVPDELKNLYATAFEVETQWLVEAAARRQKWIDQAQSLNIYIDGASGKKLDETYKLAWLRGLKTTYYLRTVGATHAEKSTVHAGAMNAVSSSGGGVSAAAAEPATDMKFCSIDDPDCEACQ
jgi:ribonucleoside-diphosphate reductase alpha chain